MKQDIKKNTYIFSEYIPNPYLLVISLFLFSWTIWFELNMRQSIFMTITFLLFDWAISFSTKKDKTI